MIKNNTISNIQIKSKKKSLNEIYFTFDIDWAHDDVILDTITLVESYNLSATWFVTHSSPVLSRLRDNFRFELGIHPNFNFLLDGDLRAGKDASEIIDKLIAIVPEAKCVRSHSLTQSSRLIRIFRDKGLTHDCNTLVPAMTGITLKPWMLFSGFIHVPYFWEDDFHVLHDSTGTQQKNPIELVTREGLKVFDFHPIHVFLNTESLDRYERTRSLHQNPKELIKHRFDGYGTRNRLIELLEISKKK